MKKAAWRERYEAIVGTPFRRRRWRHAAQSKFEPSAAMQRRLTRLDEYRRLRAEGLSLAQIGARYGVSRQAVHAMLRAYGEGSDR